MGQTEAKVLGSTEFLLFFWFYLVFSSRILLRRLHCVLSFFSFLRLKDGHHMHKTFLPLIGLLAYDYMVEQNTRYFVVELTKRGNVLQYPCPG